MHTYERPALVKIGSFTRKTGCGGTPPPDFLINRSFF